MKRLKGYFLKHIRIWFFQRKIFVGTYWDNRQAIESFITGRKIKVIHYDSDYTKFRALTSSDMSEEEKEIAIQAQQREYRRNLRKIKTTTMTYIEVNFFTKIFFRDYFRRAAIK